VGRTYRLGPRAGKELAFHGTGLPHLGRADGGRPGLAFRAVHRDALRGGGGQRGQVRAVGEAATPYRPNDAQMAYHLGRFIGLVRSLSIDSIVVRQNWLDAYNYTTDKGAVALNEYARVNDPFARIGKESVTVQISSVTRASDQSFNVRWTETRFVNGALDRTERWNAVVSIVQQTPRTEQRLRKNPLGIYVNGLSWSRELEGSEGAKP